MSGARFFIFFCFFLFSSSIWFIEFWFILGVNYGISNVLVLLDGDFDLG
jgi:hypothetical protein